MADSDSGAVKNRLTYEEAWPFLQQGIDKVIHIIEHEGSGDAPTVTSEEYMQLYMTVYNVCHPDPLVPDTRKMYDQYGKTFHDYISSKIYGEFNGQVTDAILSLINREREGEQIDQSFVKEILDIYVVIDADSLKYYEKDFEEAIVNATAEFYSKKALEWISNMSYENYMAKVEECLKQEESRVSSYLRYRTKYKLLEVVKRELLTALESKLEEKKHLDEAAA